jgi:predicted DNA binding CopG/RHH family protein
MTRKEREVEAAYAEEVYKRHAEIDKKALQILKAIPPAKTRQLTIRMSVTEIELAKTQAAALGLKYQTYIKMLLHRALTAKAG